MDRARPRGELDALLPALQREWLSWLRRHHTSISAVHMDLVQQAVLDLLQWPAWSDRREQEIRRVGYQILRRRVADQYRDSVRQWALRESVESAEALLIEKVTHGDGASLPDDVLFYRHLIEVAIAILSTLDREDRELLLRNEIGPRSDAGPLDGKQRQRISRLRRELRRVLKQKFRIELDADDSD